SHSLSPKNWKGRGSDPPALLRSNCRIARPNVELSCSDHGSRGNPMPNAEDIRWFKQQFASRIDAAVSGTPFDVDMLTAFACQETGEIWPVLRRAGLSVDQILKLCVGDTLDRKKTFPRDRAHLESRPGGKEMFESAHAALVEMAKYITGYAQVAKNANKFCKGFGIF